MSDKKKFDKGKYMAELLFLNIDLTTHEASGIASDFFQLMLKDPKKGVLEISDFIDKIRDINPERAFVEAVAGGPAAEYTVQAINILGIFYPSLEKDIRKDGLIKTISFLSRLNYETSQYNLEMVHEPWLVADIVINHRWAWCGYSQYCDLLKKNRTWEEFSKYTKSPKSRFWMALAVTRPKYSSLEVRTKFYKEFPDTMDRTKDAIAAITHSHAVGSNKREGTDIDEYIEEHLKKYDELLIDDIKKKMDERKWITLENSRDY